MRRNLFWLNDEQRHRIVPLLPTDVRGKDRVDDRQVISGILHVLKPQSYETPIAAAHHVAAPGTWSPPAEAAELMRILPLRW